jgi:hypothetical protein
MTVMMSDWPSARKSMRSTSFSSMMTLPIASEEHMLAVGRDGQAEQYPTARDFGERQPT